MSTNPIRKTGMAAASVRERRQLAFAPRSMRTATISHQLWAPATDFAVLFALSATLFTHSYHLAVASVPASAIAFNPVVLAAVISAFQVLLSKRYGVYIEAPAASLLEESFAIMRACAVAMLLLMSWFYITQSPKVMIPGLALYAVSSVVWMVAGRSIRSQVVEAGIASGSRMKNAIIVGADEVGRSLAKVLMENPRLGYTFCGFVDDDDDSSEVLGAIDDLYRVARTYFVDEVFVVSQSRREFVKKLALEAPLHRVSVTLVPDMLDGICWQVPIGRIGHIPVMVLHRPQAHHFQRFLKRVVDVAGSLFGLLVLSPVFAAIAVAIKFDSKGPIFYRGARVGKKGVIFDCLKFRTMEIDADQRLSEVAHLNERRGLLFKVTNDPRLTRLGGFLRRTSLDELPQLVNVLLGDMSLVGPRPPALHEYEQFQFEHLKKLEVTPGITGLWQVSARRDPSFENYIRYDLDYIENWSLWLDFVILLRTIPEVLRCTGV